MITLNQLQALLENLLLYDKSLDLPKIDPHMANGLVVKGENDIKKVGLGVSASLKLFQMAAERNCQALIVHHSLNFPSFNGYDEIFQKRMAFLLKHEISLFGYHFLLDSHPEIGHNAQIIKTIGGQLVAPYYFQKQPWGYIGALGSTSLDKIVRILKPKLSPNFKVYPFGKKEIKKVIAVSGKGYPSPSDLQYLITNKIDLYISGEVSEWIRELFREAEINFIAGGHYHTERFGLLALENILKQQLVVKTEFLELENEI